MASGMKGAWSMRPLCCLSDASAVIIIDASAAINLNATGCASKILAHLPNTVIIPEIVLEELKRGASRGRGDGMQTQQLIDEGLLKCEPLSDAGLAHFEHLVVGAAVDTLDDGEAATIAHAIEQNGVALIDERKAVRICGERFPSLQLGATVDIFTHPDIQSGLGKNLLQAAVVRALTVARMRVLP